jgi:hypothetical protein
MRPAFAAAGEQEVAETVGTRVAVIVPHGIDQLENDPGAESMVIFKEAHIFRDERAEH